MCGVAGIFALRAGAQPSFEELEAMVASLRHRGPDELSVHREPGLGLAHSRLAIVDPANGRQPLRSDATGTVVSYNGEIYNHVELRAELEAQGHRFRTRCDTEVLVAAYDQWGDACVDRFEGQFAFALWDPRRRRLVLARDPLGVRPLYFTRAGGRLAFASEVKALFQLADVPRELDPRGLDEVFTFWTPLAPTTMFRGVFELRPGHLMVLEAGREPTVRRFYEPEFPERGGEDGRRAPAVEASAAALEDALARATALRLSRADVPVGCYLSGGLDSSVIAALARRAHPGSLRTFSIRFADAELDEGVYQRAMVERLATEHTEVRVTRADVASSLPDVVAHVERPLLRTAPVPLFLLSRCVRDAGIKVVLTGEGADEMLGGYDLFREDKVRRFWARQPASRTRPRLLDRLYPYLTRSPREAREMAWSFFGRDLADTAAFDFSHRPRFRAAAAIKRLLSGGARAELAGRDAVAELGASLPPAFGRWGPLARAQYLEIRTLLSGYLLAAQGDRVAMAHSVEGRFPFLDRRVMEIAHAMPERHKLRVLDEKHVLKLAAAGLVPAAIRERPKQPYRAPDAVSFFEPGAPEYVGELLSERSIRDAGLFDPARVTALAARCRAAHGERQLGNQDNMALVGVLTSQLLWREFVAEPPRRASAGRPPQVVEHRRGGDDAW